MGQLWQRLLTVPDKAWRVG